MTLPTPSRDHLWRLIGLALFVFALSRIDLGQTVQRLTHARPAFLSLAAISTLPLFAIRAWRLQVVLAGTGIDLPFHQVLILRIVSSAAGDATPGRLGEFGGAAYLHRAGYAASNAALSLVIDRALDAAVFGLVAVAAAIGYPTLLPIGVIRESPVLPGVAMLRGDGAKWLRKEALIQLIHQARALWHPLRVLGAGLLSLAAFATLVFRAYCLALALEIPISFLALAGVVAISTFVQLLPISVLGIGSRDISLLYLFDRLGLSASSAISLSWLVLAMLVLQLLLGLGVWWRYPLRLATPEKRKGHCES